MSTFSISSSQGVTQKGVRGLYIADHDGQPRWIWPAASNTPTFLQFIQPVSWKQRGFVAIVQLLFMLRLQRIVFALIPLEADYDFGGNDWAIFTGTPGPNRKRVVVNEEGTITKAAVGKMAVPNLNNEAFFLRNLQARQQQFSFVTPQFIRQNERSLTMEKIASRGTWNRFTVQHETALAELREVKPLDGPICDWVEWNIIHDTINHLKNEPHAAIPAGLVSNLLRMVALEDRDKPIAYGLAHGDFTPWNTLRTDNNKLAIIDWELAHTEMPLGFDFFHFHLQNGIMVERKSWQEIYAYMYKLLTPETRAALFGNEEVDVDRYLRLYLMYHISYYLSLYQQQAQWHQQIYWQLDVWHDATSALAPPTDQRKALISRLLDGLNGYDYAVLKMEHDDPLALPADSDLDVLIGRKDAGVILEKLLTFPLLAQYKVVKKSFMVSVFLLLEDGQVLNIDLIWKLKRKIVVFMEVSGMIQNARQNGYGVPVVSLKDTRKYLQLFYGLNGATIPAKFGLVQDGAPLPPLLSANKGLRGVGNYVLYLQDTVRTMLFNRGFILTFSGVDGAGKSTVIDHVIKLVDKQFRRPVKVLRHRPSILPILSAYRYGKERAEQKSIASLPRTGNNTSQFSSLVRFSYYYIDYLLGQWYVHLRYVLRGYVVVYDRYYYDFLIDARRSNIQLPSWITATGFWLLKKPAFNFFLFAHPDIILARKKELSRDTIVSLTQRYLSLFERYNNDYSSGIFTNIENIVLEDTLAVVRKTLLQHNR
jgi:thymidylate kinase